MDLDKPSWSILKLPNEVLGRIVELVDIQDKVTEQRIERLRETEIGERLGELMEYERSLGPLSLTCERIRSLAAPFLFSVHTRNLSHITLSHATELIQLLCAVVRQYRYRRETHISMSHPTEILSTYSPCRPCQSCPRKINCDCRIPHCCLLPSLRRHSRVRCLNSFQTIRLPGRFGQAASRSTR